MFTFLNLQKLKKTPRYLPGIFSFKNKKIKYLDSLSLYHEYKDIFEYKIYDFSTDNPTPFIIDAGACIGMSILYFKMKYPNAEILAFEPDPQIYQICNENISNNNLSKVKLLNSGLGNDETTRVFHPDGVDGGSFFVESAGKGIQKLKMEKLSKYINRPVDLLKMNIEGSENEVFEDLHPVLHYVKEIIFEYHAFYDLNQTLGNILNILDQTGFRYLVTDATNAKIPVPFHLSKNYHYFNLVYAKNVKYI